MKGKGVSFLVPIFLGLTLLTLALAGCAPNPLASCSGSCAERFWQSASVEDAKLALDAGAELETPVDQVSLLLPLMLVAKSNPDPLVASLLLDEGAYVDAMIPPDAPPWDSRTALHFAAWQNENSEMVALLLDRGADITVPAGKGLSTLHLAAMNENPEVARLILSHGADIDEIATKSYRGRRPIGIAISYKNFLTAKLLLESGATLDYVNDWGNTPLHTAALQPDNDSPEIIRWLLNNGMDASARNNQGQRPCDLVLKRRVDLEQNQPRVLALIDDANDRVREARLSSSESDINLAIAIRDGFQSGFNSGQRQLIAVNESEAILCR